MATIFKDSFKCKQVINTASFTSFEHQLFPINNPSLVLVAVIYRPPKHSEHFIAEFADFLSCFILYYERISIVGDFNIHICCEDKPLVKDFLNIIDSFNLTQFVSGPTHQHGHTLDLVLGHGLSVSVNEHSILPVLDHSLILFDIIFSELLVSRRDKGKQKSSRYISPAALTDFNSRLPDVMDAVFSHVLSLSAITENFNDSLQDLMDFVAPAKLWKAPKKSSTP